MIWICSAFLIAYSPIGLELVETDDGSHLVVVDDEQFVGLVQDEEILSVQEFDFDGSEEDIADDLEPPSGDKLKVSNTPPANP